VRISRTFSAPKTVVETSVETALRNAAFSAPKIRRTERRMRPLRAPDRGVFSGADSRRKKRDIFTVPRACDFAVGGAPESHRT
jgi:hypothetical protein